MNCLFTILPAKILEIEEGMLRFFCNNVLDATRSILRDKELPLPFANLQLRRGQVKNHGLGKMKK